MMHLSQLRSLRSKKILLIIGAAVLFLVISAGAYVVWSKQVWEKYTPAYTGRHQSIQSDIKSIATSPAANMEEQTALLVRLESASDRIATEQKSLCKVNMWVEWQQRFISTYSDAQTSCREKAADLTAFQKQLDAAIAFIKDDQALAKIISSAAPPGELADSTWEKQVSTWDGAIAATAKLSVSDTFKPTQQRAIEKMTAVKKAWTELIAAHQQKDKTKYLAAQSVLGVSYDGLNMIADESTKSMSSLAKILNAAHANAFD